MATHAIYPMCEMARRTLIRSLFYTSSFLVNWKMVPMRPITVQRVHTGPESQTKEMLQLFCHSL